MLKATLSVSASLASAASKKTSRWKQTFWLPERGMFKEHERIVLTAAIPAEGLEAGDVGTVVHLYGDGLAYEVEFTTLNGDTAAVVTVEACQARPVHKRAITHARELQTA